LPKYARVASTINEIARAGRRFRRAGVKAVPPEAAGLKPRDAPVEGMPRLKRTGRRPRRRAPPFSGRKPQEGGRFCRRGTERPEPWEQTPGRKGARSPAEAGGERVQTAGRRNRGRAGRNGPANRHGRRGRRRAATRRGIGDRRLGTAVLFMM